MERKRLLGAIVELPNQSALESRPITNLIILLGAIAALYSLRLFELCFPLFFSR